MNKVELNERFAKMWKKSREDAGKSQEFMAKSLGVSKKTVQNWEDGTSSPNQIRALEWFEAINLQPLPYYLQVLYPGKYTEPNSGDIDTLLCDFITALPYDLKEKLLFGLAGNHGSSTVSVIEMLTAHLQSPLDRRINTAQSALINYELSDYQGTVCCKDEPKPNVDTLNRSIMLAKKAVMSGLAGYDKIGE